MTDRLSKRGKYSFEQLNVLQWQQQRLAIGWLAGSFPESRWNEVKSLLELTFNTGFVKRRGGRNFFAECWSATIEPSAFFMCRNSVHEDELDGDRPQHHQHGWAFFQVNASVIESLIPRWFFYFLGQLRKLEFRPTRIDISYDDWDRILGVEALWRFKQAGFITRFKKARPYMEHVESKGVFWEGVSLGSRGSKGGGFYVRYYDKSIESGGKIDAIRLELEASDEKARAIWDEISLCVPDSWQDDLGQIERHFCSKLAGILAGVFDIVVKSKSGHLSRSWRLPVWQTFLDGLASNLVKLVGSRRRSNLKKSMDAFKRQWAPNFALFRALMFGNTSSLGTFSDWIHSVIVDGESRWTDKHLAMLMSELESGALGI